jgi:hypothetical protein
MAGARHGMCELTARHGAGTAWTQHAMCESALTLKLLTTTIVAPPSNASKWQMGFNSVFKGLNCVRGCRLGLWLTFWSVGRLVCFRSAGGADDTSKDLHLQRTHKHLLVFMQPVEIEPNKAESTVSWHHTS